jgi:hypothetical protein
VIHLYGSQRTGSNLVGRVIEACGASTGRYVVPRPSRWNREYSDDPWVLAYTSYLCGAFGPGGLPGPLDLATETAGEELPRFVAYLRGRYEAAQRAVRPYLFKSNAGCRVWGAVRGAFPEGARHALVVTSRDPAASAASLASLTRCDHVVCAKYLADLADDTERFARQRAAAGWPVFRVSFEAVQRSPQSALEPVITALGLTAPPAAWLIFDPAQVRF